MENIVCVENVVMEYDLNRGKVRSLKEKMYNTLHPVKEDRKMFRALDGVSFTVKKGEIFGIIGNNGAGKFIGYINVCQLHGFGLFTVLIGLIQNFGLGNCKFKAFTPHIFNKDGKM